MENWVNLMGMGARGVLIILFLLSIWSVGIMFDRRRVFNRELSSSKLDDLRNFIQAKNWDALKTWSNANPSYLAGVVKAALESGSKDSENLDRVVQSYMTAEKIKMERGLNILATLGANAPFIGLFGTVLGIIQSFGILSSQQGSAMNAVMLGLAEALIATAVGLFVAIPAVVAYNYFGQRLRNATLEAQSIRDLMVSKLHG
ncbi:MAG: MotA/TolQ/ExbB proton channel family protein [Bdellovibrionales bacterium]|nr:MotA/TolQ/ExbB proton channel family protein [Bdellovibrionales bacterium]